MKKLSKRFSKLVDIVSFPLIKENKYTGRFDYVFIEGTFVLMKIYFC
jgi:hypothetical protein